MPPFVPGFVITGDPSGTAGSQWDAVRRRDGLRFVLMVLPVADASLAQDLAARQMAAYHRVRNEHLVRRHRAIAFADGTLGLVVDEVSGGSLAQLLSARGQLTAGETVTAVAPLFGALADLHAAGVVHGDLAPGSILFSSDGRPLIGDLGVAALLGRQAGKLEGFVAPELVNGAAVSPASDVYAMAALGWFCLTGGPVPSAATRPSLTTLCLGLPPRLVDVLTDCLAADPSERPTAGAAAAEIFDAAPAESVALVSVGDPAAEVTRRIRAAAASAPDPAPPGIWKRYQAWLGLALVAVLVTVAGAGATWFLRRPPAASQHVAVPSATDSLLQPAVTASRPFASPLPWATLPTAVMPEPAKPGTARAGTAKAGTVRPGRAMPTRLAAQVPNRAVQTTTDVVTAPGSPRLASAALLQALVDARALAYLTRNPALLDLVYAPGATKAGVDRGNIATALTRGGTYLGLSFVIKDATFLDGTPGTARIRAIILTPAYRTGQPDGREVRHARETLGPGVFSLTLTPDGWRVVALTAP